MRLLTRIRTKLADLRAYPRLAWGARDHRELWILGLVQHRVPGSRFAAALLAGRGRVVTPRLTLTHGQRIRVELDQPGQRDVFRELFLERIYDLDLVGFRPSLVLDCGAYCGYFSAMAAGAYPEAEIVCFEANPSHIAMLGAQLALLDRRVELRAAAVHVRDGTVEFSGSGTGGAISDAVSEGGTRVPCVDLPKLMKSRSPTALVLKMDVEGAELQLLPAMLAVVPSATVVFLETHYPDVTCESLLAPYAAAGFSVREIRRRVAAGKDFCYVEWVLSRRP
jgi:FkbM family methyltransferase